MSTHTLQVEHPRSVTRREIVLSVVVPLALVAAVNFVVAIQDIPGKLNWGHRLVTQKWFLVESDGPAVDWLVLGDSSGNQSVKPELIKSERGATALNVCTIGDCLVAGDAWMLAEYIERHGPPKRVALIHVWDTWPSDDLPTQVLARIPLTGDFWNRLEPHFPLDLRQRFDVFAAHWLPLYSQSLSLSEWVLKLPLHLLGRARPELPKIGADGFSAFSNASPDLVTRDSEVHIRTLAESPEIRVSQINIDAMLAIAVLAERYGFDVDVITGPVSERLGSDSKYQEALASIEAQLRAALYDAPEGGTRVHLFLTNPRQFASDQMTNADHVVGAAADEYTRSVIDRVAR